MAKTDYKNIDQYHDAFSGEVLRRMQVIRRIIHHTVPGVEEAISYQIPCFKHQGYLLYYSAYTKHLTLSYPFSAAFLEHFSKQLMGYKVSKSAIQLPLSEPLPEQFIQEIVAFRKAENLANASKK